MICDNCSMLASIRLDTEKYCIKCSNIIYINISILCDYCSNINSKCSVCIKNIYKKNYKKGCSCT